MQKEKREYDTSDYPPDHFLYSRDNAKVIGKFKDECNSIPPLEFAGLRSKMYSLLLPNNKEKKTAKGIKKGFVSNRISHDDYKRCIFEERPTSANFCLIRSTNHNVQTLEITKAALSPFDDKRFLVNSTDSYAYGHVDIALFERFINE